MLEIKLLKDHRDLKDGLVWLPLLGKLKGDDGVGTHFLRSIPVTESGISIQAWRDRLLAVHAHAGRMSGPAISDSEGYLMTSGCMNDFLWKALESLYDRTDGQKSSRRPSEQGTTLEI